MKDFSLKIKKIILLTGDIIILYFSLWLALFIRRGFQLEIEDWQKHILPFTFIFIIWLIVLFINGYYELKSIKSNASFYSNVLVTSLINLVLAIIFLYLITNRLTTIRPQTVLLLNIIIFTVVFMVWRQLFNQLTKNKAWANNVAIIGLNKKTLKIIKEINSKPHLGYRVDAIMTSQEDEDGIHLENIKIINDDSDLVAEINKRKINTIISTVNTTKYPDLINKLFTCLSLGINFFDYATFYENYTGKIPVTTIKQTWFLENLTENSKRLYERMKRIIDIVFALIGIMIALPFVPLIVMIIKIDSKGSTIFKQNRAGKNGKIFSALKFRTMKIDAEKDGPQWAQKDDPRVTGVGKFLRKSRIDEIPQLINVLKNEMSLIGPRPERPEFIKMLQQEIPFYKERLLIKPGLTGWAQINFPYGASKEDALEKLQYDLYYIKNRSLILDLSTLLKTVRIVLSREGR